MQKRSLSSLPDTQHLSLSADNKRPWSRAGAIGTSMSEVRILSLTPCPPGPHTDACPCPCICTHMEDLVFMRVLMYAYAYALHMYMLACLCGALVGAHDPFPVIRTTARPSDLPICEPPLSNSLNYLIGWTLMSLDFASMSQKCTLCPLVQIYGGPVFTRDTERTWGLVSGSHSLVLRLCSPLLARQDLH